MDRKQKILELKRKLQEIKTKHISAQGGGKFTGAIEELLNQESTIAQQSVAESPTSNAIRALAEKVTEVEKKDPRIGKIISTIKKADTKYQGQMSALDKTFSDKVALLLGEVRDSESRGEQMTTQKMEGILTRFDEYRTTFENDKRSLSNKSTLLQGEVSRISQEVERVYNELSSILLENVDDTQKLRTALDALSKELLDIEVRLNSRLGNLGGGNMNRNIAIGGNQSVLSQFNDINLKPGSNVTLTYTNNQTTGFVDVTIAANASGSGITRSVNAISTSQNAGATAGTDYVYVCSAGVAVTLPTAVGNTNLYTIKNTSASSVLVATTGGETVDSDANVILATQYTAVDLISNGSNWSIT